MKLFLDDKRPFPKEELGYNSFRSYTDFCNWLELYKNYPIDIVSLDYDLGTEKTGFDILTFMFEQNIHPQRINIHSAHITGVGEMEEYAKANFKASTITTNGYE